MSPSTRGTAIVLRLAKIEMVVRAVLRHTLFRLLASIGAFVVGAVALTPSSWWRHGAQVIAAPGELWVPVLLVTAGTAGLVRLTARWWRSRAAVRRRLVVVRVPLFVHVAALLLIAVAVAAVVGAGMWIMFGRPHLTFPGTTTTPGTAPAGVGAWSVQNTFDAMKIVLSVVAGIGGVVALTVAYRRQGHSEAAEHREDTKLFNDRFGKAADQLGSDKGAVRLAGVYAMAGLADDWDDARQTCIDVLCAYLRMPYAPPPLPTAEQAASTTLTEVPSATAERIDGDADAHQEQQVRHTVLALIGEHLHREDAERGPRWHGHYFDLRGAVIDGGDLKGIHVADGTVLDLSTATFPSGTLDFTVATFSRGSLDFTGARFTGGTVTFTHARFTGGMVTFADARFSGGRVDFTHAMLVGGAVVFSRARFSGGEVDFTRARFSGGTVSFSFSYLHFLSTRLRPWYLPGGAWETDGAVPPEGGPLDWTVPPVGLDGSEPGVQWPSAEQLIGITKG